VAALPQPKHSLAQAIYGLHERRGAAEQERPYLGVSELGEPCARRLYYRFHWMASERFDGRMYRLFETGHREEARLLDELRAIGLEVWDRQPDGTQYSVQAFNGHLRGHLDAVVLGLPEAPKTPHVFDVKTINKKKFGELQKNGLAKTYPKYHAQGTGYCGLMELDRAAFAFVCKDDETIALERFEFDEAEFNRLMARAESVIFAAEPLPKISTDPAFWECKFCPAYELCHGTAAPPATCRSCLHATAMRDGTWRCELHDKTLSVDEQRAGCADHRFIPSLLSNFAELLDAEGNNIRYRNNLTGVEFVNGERPGYSSSEIAACADKRALGDNEIDAMREEFDARIVNTRG
jgi:hypothetical protein